MSTVVAINMPAVNATAAKIGTRILPQFKLSVSHKSVFPHILTQIENNTSRKRMNKNVSIPIIALNLPQILIFETVIEK